MQLLFEHIGTLAGIHPSTAAPLRGEALSALPSINNAFLLLEDDKIAAFGPMEELYKQALNTNIKRISAAGKTVLPSWCDSHTHIVFAGSREQEFVDRIRGLSYEEIAKRGGGILNSAEKLRAASEEELFESATNRLNDIIQQGTGAVEIKSGYGLSIESELKMLRVIKRLKASSPLSIKATFLGAHAIPNEFKGRKNDYLRMLIDELLPIIASEQLADYCDIFCENNYFDALDTKALLAAAAKLGIQGKVHAEQLSHSGGIRAGIEAGAVSVDHLEYISDEDIELLKNSSTIPTLLPGAQFFLNLPLPPARKMLNAALPVAIATDFNPGSAPSGNMAFNLSLACVLYKMTPEEAINAATINGAFAMGLGSSHGSITVGKKANILITRPIPGPAFIPYSFANNLVEQVILNGKIINTL